MLLAALWEGEAVTEREFNTFVKGTGCVLLKSVLEQFL
jgi:hypothetical protein